MKDGESAPAVRSTTQDWARSPWLIVALVAIIVCYRRPEQIFRPTLWWEDGTLYFAQDRVMGWRAIFDVPFGGYLVLIQRLIAFVGGLLSLSVVPTFYSFCACAALLAMAWICLQSRIPTPYRAALALTLVLVPHGGEIFLHMNILHYLLTPLLVILMLQDEPTCRKHWVVDLLVLVLVGLSGPFIIFLFPLLVVTRLYRGGVTKYNLVLILMALLVAGTQLFLLVYSGRPARLSPASAGLRVWFDAVMLNCVGPYFLGKNIPLDVPVVARIAAPLLCMSLLVIAWRVDRKVRVQVCCLLIAALTIYAAGLMLIRANPMENGPFHGGQRYFYTPYVLLSWALILACQAQRWIRNLAVFFLGLGMLSAATKFSVPFGSPLPWAKGVALLKDGYVVRIPINPPGQWIRVGPRDRENGTPLETSLNTSITDASVSVGQPPK